MQFLNFRLNNIPRLGLMTDTGVIDLQSVQPAIPAEIGAALKAGVDLKSVGEAALRSSAPRIALERIEYAACVQSPGKILCLGLNYFDHANEVGRQTPTYPIIFMRSGTSLMGHSQPTVRPRISTQFDYEAELAVVIGKTVPRHVSEEKALGFVFGYACFNDISVRDYQLRTSQWIVGKNFDATGGFGPTLVTADAVPAGAIGLKIEGRLNGNVMQSANTKDMIFGVAKTIALMSECMTLEPGDVLVMGTPGGVGLARKPQLWMVPGDKFEVEIEGLGVLANTVVDEAAA